MPVQLTPISSTSNLVTTARAIQNAQLSALSSTSPAYLESLLDAASRAVERICKRGFLLAAYREYYDGPNHPHDAVKLRQFPVASVERVATSPEPALEVRNADSTTNQRATVATGESGLTLLRVASGVPTTVTLDYEAYPTLAALAAQVAATAGGWAATVAGGYGLWPSADLRPLQGAATCLNGGAELELFVEDVPPAAWDGWTSAGPCWRLDAEAGILSGRFPPGRQNLRIDYTAGYATVPEDVQQACVAMAQHLYEMDRAAGGATGWTLGPYSRRYDPGQMAAPPFVSLLLSRYVDHSRLIDHR